MSQLAKFDFRVAPNQQLDAVFKIPQDNRGVIHGQVIDECNKPIEDAVVKLFEFDNKWDGKWDCKKPECQKMHPLTHAFTDECGQFLFGPLCADKHYFIKIWVNDVCVAKDFVEFKRDCDCIKSAHCECYEEPKNDGCKCDDKRH